METREITQLKPHPLNAEIYGDGCNKELLDDMREHTFRTSKPLVITSEQSEIGGNIIISGHRRFNAAQMLHIESVPVIISPLLDRLDIEEELIRANNDEETQRKKTTEQKAREYKALKRIEEARAKLRMSEGGKNKGCPNLGNLRSDDVAAERVGMKRTTADKAAQVVDIIDTAKTTGNTAFAAEMTERLNASVDGAYKEVKPVIQATKQAEREVRAQTILTTEDEIQRRIDAESKRRAKAQFEELLAKKQQEKEAKKQARLEKIEAQKQKIEAESVSAPSGLFDVIAVDPPWDYSEKGGYSAKEHDADGNRGGVDYPTMTVEEIKQISLPIKENGVVFLWTVHKFLPDAFSILESWNADFKYVLTWDKEKMGMGRTARLQCEFCLVAFMGKPYFTGSAERDIIRASRREHSRKPDEFFQYVERVTAGRKLEYFSRERRDGWEVYGDEATKF